MSGSGISWAMCKSAPHSRQITTPAPHQARCPFCHPTNSIKALKATDSDITEIVCNISGDGWHPGAFRWNCGLPMSTRMLQFAPTAVECCWDEACCYNDNLLRFCQHYYVSLVCSGKYAALVRCLFLFYLLYFLSGWPQTWNTRGISPNMENSGKSVQPQEKIATNKVVLVHLWS